MIVLAPNILALASLCAGRANWACYISSVVLLIYSVAAAVVTGGKLLFGASFAASDAVTIAIMALLTWPFWDYAISMESRKYYRLSSPPSTNQS
jgi:hypothetical protein